MNIAGILKNIDTNILSEETASAIAVAFQEAVETKVSERLNLEKEKVLKEQDEDHATKLKALIEAIDKDHTSKLKQVVEAITLNHTAKLQKISSYYEKAIKEKAENFSNKIVEEMSNYLDLYLDKIVPKEQLAEAVANVSAKRQLAEIKKILAFDKSFVNENVQRVIVSGKRKIDEIQNQLSSVLKENNSLKQQMSQTQTNLLLEQKTKGMPSSKKSFVVKILEDKTPQYIKENFDYVVEMFDREDRDVSNKLVKEAVQSAVTKSAKVIQPSTVQVTEQLDPKINEYVSYLKGIR